jgi:hypothetical protein
MLLSKNSRMALKPPTDCDVRCEKLEMRFEKSYDSTQSMKTGFQYYLGACHPFKDLKIIIKIKQPNDVRCKKWG